MAWEHGNLKTDTNTYYNITLFSSANIGRNYWFRDRYQMIYSSFHMRYVKDTVLLSDIWKRYPQYLRKQFWKEHTFWTDGYFACSVGNVSEEMLKRYIKNQG